MLELLLGVTLFFIFLYLRLDKKYKELKAKKSLIQFIDKDGNKRQINPSDFFCPNLECEFYKTKGKNNVIKRKFYGAYKDRVLFRCTCCGKEFSETRGTMYFQKKKPISLIIKITHYLIEGGEIRKASRLFGVSQTTVLSYLKDASKKAKLMNHLHHGMKFSAFQFDELWSFIFKKDKNLKSEEKNSKGSFYGFVSYQFQHRFIIDIHNGKRNDDETIKFISKQKKFIDPKNYVLIMSDGFSAYMTAMLKVFGRKSLFIYNKENEPITILPDKILYGQMIKKRKSGKVVNIEYKILNGTKKKMNYILKKTGCNQITTSLIERVNLSIRHHIGRFKRKGMGFSKNQQYHEAALELFQATYNYTMPNRGLGKISPAMSVGIVDRIWGIDDILRYQGAI